MSDRADQRRCTELILDATPDAAIVSNLGVASCVLADVAERPENCYLWGSMGSTTAVGLGVSLDVDRQVTVLDGDGSTLMSLGTLATVGTYGPENLTIVVFDNKVYATTGGQRTRSETTDLAGVARECGVRSVRVSTETAFERTYAEAINADEPTVIVCEVAEASTETLPPREFASVARRFRGAVGEADQ